MESLTRGIPVLVVESDRALPEILYAALDNLDIEVLGPTNDIIDILRLARDRRPQLAILADEMEKKWLLELEVILAEFGVPCIEFRRAGCDQIIKSLSVQEATLESKSISVASQESRRLA
jgi:hypothetical protein